MRFIKKFLLGFTITFFLFVGVDIARASLFGEENAILGKILLEDVQQTLHLADIIKFASKELNVINEKYGYDRWINKGLDEVKDYGLLKYIKTDDFIMGTLQNDMGKVGIQLNADDYNFDNVEEWIELVWGKAPEAVNIQTEYPGSIEEWKFQTEHNLPSVYSGYSPMRTAVNRTSSELAYKQALWNMQFTEKSKQLYQDLLLDASVANPGKSARIAAQSNAYQNIQLEKINSTQNSILRLMAEKRLSHLQKEDMTQVNIEEGFSGVMGLFKSFPTLMQ